LERRLNRHSLRISVFVRNKPYSLEAIFEFTALPQCAHHAAP
jgi:hypothetical protein